MGNCQGRQAIDKSNQQEDQVDAKNSKKRQSVKSLMQEQNQLAFAKGGNKLNQIKTQNSQLQGLAQQQQDLYNQRMQIMNRIQQEQRAQTVENISNYTISQNISNQNANSMQKQYLQQALSTNGQFIDREFPADIRSLTSYPQLHARENSYQWIKANQIRGLDGSQGQITIFQGITPQDIKQGALGDCYLLSSLSALAEHQEQNLISRIFEIKNFNLVGAYGIWLNIQGEWQLVVVDDIFPCDKYGNPAYSRANGPELWVLLIEKAYAKIYGNYKKIEAGLTGNAVRDLTGAPYIYLDNEDVDETWDALELYDNNQNILTAGTQSDNRGIEYKQDNGVVSGHAYSILDHQVVVDSYGQQCRIIKLRNPWGSHEWTGKFSDNSDAWTPELRQRLQVTSEDDGIFWMPVEDFCREYAETTINLVNRNYKHSSMRIQSGYGQCHRIDLNIQGHFHGYVSINQKAERYFEDEMSQAIGYQYSMVRGVLCKVNRDQFGKETFEYIQDCYKAERDVDINITGESGQYALFVQVDWAQDKVQDFVVSTYTCSHVQLQAPESYSTEKFESVLDDVLLTKLPDLINENVFNYNKDGSDLFRVRGNVAGYIYYKYVNKTSNQTLDETLTLKNMQYLEMLQVENVDGDSINALVPPGDVQIYKAKIQSQGQGGYSFGTSFSYGIGYD